MKITFSSLAGLALVGIVASCGNPKSQESLTLADYENAAMHMAPNMSNLVYHQVENSQWVADSLLTYSKAIAEGTAYLKVNTKTGEKAPAFDKSNLALALSAASEQQVNKDSLPFSRYTLQPTGEVDFRAFGRSYRFSPDEGKVAELQPEQPKDKRARFENISPDGKKAAYIKDHNLWVRNTETGQHTQLTFDGVEDHGYATDNAGWTHSDRPVMKWSPNSDKIATFRQDARKVGEMYLVNTKVGHPDLEAWKYPLPGDSAVFMIERVVIHLEPKPRMVKLDMEPDFQRSTTTDHIAGRGGDFLDVEWKQDGSALAFVSSSRDHKTAALKIADPNTGKVTPVLTETVPTYYESGVDGECWTVLHDSNEVIWYSERDNWGHLYLYDLNTGALKQQITTGDWQVQGLIRIDEANREIWFTAGGREEGNPYYQYLYKTDFEGKNIQCLTPEKGHHRLRFSPNKNYVFDTYSTTVDPPVSVLRDLDGNRVADLETADIAELKAAGWQEPVEFTVKARDKETDLYGIMFLPSNFDENASYPVLNYIYPGPQSGSVNDYSFRATRGDRQAVAELGFIVVGVDAMGTPGRSKSFHDAYYGNMGDNGLPDNITMIRQLAERYPAMDTTRVGIWGHSGGGFASTDAVLRYPDFYDVAVSGSGNHDNRNYEDDWGEKWQGLLEINAEGLNNYSDQANQLMAENLKGHLLITHGQLDDNVHPSNTMLVVEALIKANKDFDMIIFPNKRHGYGNMTNYMTRKRWDYFVKHLKGMEPPKGFSF